MSAPVGLRDHRQARIRPCRASHLHLASTVQFHIAGSYEDHLIFAIQNSSPKLAIRTRSRSLNPALISAAPHYGLRYGCASATGNFQRLRGRPPLVSPLKSCMSRSFTAVTHIRISAKFSRLIASRAVFVVCCGRSYQFLDEASSTDERCNGCSSLPRGPNQKFDLISSVGLRPMGGKKRSTILGTLRRR
jgi:hypothetical protein